MQFKELILIPLLALLLSACNLLQTSETAVTPVVITPTTTLAASTPLPAATPDLGEPVIITNSIQTLRVWLPPELGSSDPEQKTLLQTQIDSFAANRPNLNILVEYKQVSGQGGILSYLRTGRGVAPTILPDLVALPTDQLAPAIQESLIQPLDGLIETAQIESLYPAAQTFAQPADQLVGYPFSLTRLTHFAYNSNAISETLATDWDALATIDDVTLAMAGGGNEGAALVLQFYLSAGGRLTNEAGQPTLQADTLAFALKKLSDAVAEGWLSPALNQSTTNGDVWELFKNNRVTLIVTTTQDFLVTQERPAQTAVAPISGIQTALTPLVGGWAWAISTANITQQQTAVELIDYLNEPQQLGAATQQLNLLPALPAAFDHWSNTNTAYLQFLGEELNRAQAQPVAPTSPIITVLRDAALEVIVGSSSPQTAAETAVAKLQP